MFTREKKPSPRFLVLIAAIMLGFSFLGAFMSAQGESIGSWTANPNSAAAQGSQSCVLDSNIATIFCVIAGASSFVYYNTYSGGVTGSTWTATTPITTGNANAYNWACTSSGNLIYCISRNPSGAGSCIAYYATMTGTGVSSWTNTNAPTTYCSAVSYGTNVNCGISQGFEYCAGGGNPNLLLTVASVSGAGFGTWTQSTQAAGVNLQSCTVSSTTAAIYCVGGSPGAYSASTAYCPVSAGAFGTCRSGGLFQATDYPFAVSDTFCFTQFNYLYCVGGTDSTPTYQTAVWYAPITTTSIGAWVTTNQYPIAAREIDCTIDSGGMVACFGGFNGGGINNSYYSAISQGVSTSTSQTTVNTLCLASCSGSSNGTAQYLTQNTLYFYASQNIQGSGLIDNVTLKVSAVHVTTSLARIYVLTYVATGAPGPGNLYALAPGGITAIDLINGSTNFFIHANPQSLLCASCFYAVGVMPISTASRGSGASASGISIFESSLIGPTEYNYVVGSSTPPPNFFSSTVQTPRHFMFIHSVFNVAIVTSTSTTTLSGLVTATTTITATSLDLALAVQSTSTDVILLLVILLPAVTLLGITAFTTRSAPASLLMFVVGLMIGSGLGVYANLVPPVFMALSVIIGVMIIFGISRMNGGISSGGGA